MSGWTDERVEQLKKLWLLGWSASQIAKELGAVTRNAVIGKIHRLDLVARQSPKMTPPPALTSSFMGAAGKTGAKAAYSAQTITIKPATVPASSYQPPAQAFAQLAARGRDSQAAIKAGSIMPGNGGGQLGRTLSQAVGQAVGQTSGKAAGLASTYGSYKANSGSDRPLDRLLNGAHGNSGRQCQWPVGDPRSAGFHFCGCQPLETTPYCSEHAKLAYQPSGKSRRVNVGGGDLHSAGTPDEREISIRA